jgi:N-acetylglucosaminylphosphatidylinositol deacetylase
MREAKRSSKLTSSHKKTALILTAHPDDEAMFFSPTIINLVAAGWMIRAICLSSGNSSGLGSIRAEELYASYKVLGVPEENVQLIEAPYVFMSNPPNSRNLEDGMQYQWEPAIIANIVSRHLISQPADIVRLPTIVLILAHYIR